MGPGAPVLARNVKVSLRDLIRQEQAVMRQATRFPQLGKTFGPQHSPERVGCIDGAIDNDMGDMHPFGKTRR